MYECRGSKERWKWALCSEEVSAVQKLEANFLKTVEAVKTLAEHKRKELKKEKVSKILKALEK